MKWLILTLVVLSILIVMPPILYHYVYPSWGGDSADHLIYFHNMGEGFPMISFFNVSGDPPLYYGQYAVGKLLNGLPFDVNFSFLWFNYIAFVLMVWAIGISVHYTVNLLAGILASILASFGSIKAVGLFLGGTIFDLMGIGLFLPLALLCMYNWKRGLGWKVAGIVLLVVFTLNHTNGRYVIALLPIMVVYEMFRERMSRALDGMVRGIWENRFMMYIAGLVVALLVGFAINIAGGNSVRLFTDAMILGMVFLGAVVTLVPFFRKRVAQYVLVVLAVAFSLSNLFLWFQNNNVVKNADKQAFDYLNGLSNITVSAVVSQDIYQVFVRQQFVNLGKELADYVVVRSIPMAFRKGYDQDTLDIVSNLGNYDYKLVKSFNYDEKEYLTGENVVVNVYGRLK